MIVLGTTLFVKELQKDMTVNGLVQKYDDSSPYMLVKIEALGKDLENIPEYQDIDNIVLLILRGNKTPYRDGYIIDNSPVKFIYTKEEYEAL